MIRIKERVYIIEYDGVEEISTDISPIPFNMGIVDEYTQEWREKVTISLQELGMSNYFINLVITGFYDNRKDYLKKSLKRMKKDNLLEIVVNIIY